ncbi:hypothetical protein MCECM63_00117 [Methylophilaceae bacterium]
MIDLSVTQSPVTVENASGKVVATPKKIDLSTINDVRLEMASVYRGMRNGSIETSDGSRLVYVLTQVGKMIEMHDLELKIKLLEEKFL